MDEAPKFSDPFDRASVFALQMSDILKKLDVISDKIDRQTELMHQQDKRISLLERNAQLYVAGIIVAVLFSVIAIAAVIWR